MSDWFQIQRQQISAWRIFIADIKLLWAIHGILTSHTSSNELHIQMHFKELNCSSAEDSQMDLIISICASRRSITNGSHHNIHINWKGCVCEFFELQFQEYTYAEEERLETQLLQFWILKSLTKASASEEAVLCVSATATVTSLIALIKASSGPSWDLSSRGNQGQVPELMFSHTAFLHWYHMTNLRVSFFKLFCSVVYHSTLVALAQIILSFKMLKFSNFTFHKRTLFLWKKMKHFLEYLRILFFGNVIFITN
jgi:hypothetical protein